MALPTKEKTWQYGTAGDPDAFLNYTIAGTANARETAQRALWWIKECLIGFSNAPWTVVGSCDASSFAMDGTDYWVDYEDIVFQTDANDYSWIVLKQTGIAANFQICIAALTANATYPRITLVVSQNAGFTGGGLSDRPTATDERVVLDESDWFWISSSTNSDGVIDVMESTDGECTRVVFCGSNAAVALLLIDKPKNPDANWTNPWVVGHKRGNQGSDQLTYSSFNDNDEFYGQFTGVDTTYYLATIGFNNAMIGEQIGGANEVENAYEIYPIWLYCPTASRKGTHGQLYDLWFSAADGVVTGDTYPLAGGMTFAQFSEMVFAWDGATVPVITGS
jgi:hypothetical protein